MTMVKSSGFEKADVVINQVYLEQSKTPLSMFLAYKKIKAANLPLVPGTMPENYLKFHERKSWALLLTHLN